VRDVWLSAIVPCAQGGEALQPSDAAANGCADVSETSISNARRWSATTLGVR